MDLQFAEIDAIHFVQIALDLEEVVFQCTAHRLPGLSPRLVPFLSIWAPRTGAYVRLGVDPPQRQSVGQ
jgi:hypothetical protein